ARGNVGHGNPPKQGAMAHGVVMTRRGPVLFAAGPLPRRLCRSYFPPSRGAKSADRVCPAKKKFRGSFLRRPVRHSPANPGENKKHFCPKAPRGSKPRKFAFSRAGPQLVGPIVRSFAPFPHSRRFLTPPRRPESKNALRPCEGTLDEL